MGTAAAQRAGAAAWRIVALLAVVGASVGGWALGWWTPIFAVGLIAAWVALITALGALGMIPADAARESNLRQMRIGGTRSEGKPPESE